MAVYKPKRKTEESKYYICEFVFQGKRFQESTGSTKKTIAKEYEKRRKEELERAAAGLPTEKKASRIRTVNEVVDAYLSAYALSHRPKSVLFAQGRLERVKTSLGAAVLSDLTEDRVREYVRERQSEGVSGRTINMEIGELSRAIGRTWRELWPRVRKLEERKDVGRALRHDEQQALLDGLKNRRTPHLGTLMPVPTRNRGSCRSSQCSVCPAGSCTNRLQARSIKRPIGNERTLGTRLKMSRLAVERSGN